MGEGEHQSGSSPLRTADQYAGDEHQHAADHDLERRLQERRVHVAVRIQEITASSIATTMIETTVAVTKCGIR